MRYQIWNKTDNVITPIGEVLTPEQWILRYPIAGVEGVKIIIGGGVINGTVMFEYTSTVERFERMGCDFSNCKTERDVLDAMEAFEDAMGNASAPETGSNTEATDVWDEMALAIEEGVNEV